MRVSKRRARHFAVVLVALGAAAATPGATAGNTADDKAPAQNAVATGGWLATGVAPRIKDPGGGSYSFKALLMSPEGTAEGNGPQRPGEPDLRQPWLSLVETVPDSSGRGRTACVSFANPTSAKYAGTGRGQVPDIVADIRCEDGRGYDFYRLRWRGTEPLDFGLAESSIPLGPYQEWWRSWYVFDRPHYAGGMEWMTLRYDGGSAARFSICGHRGGESECLGSDGRSDPWQSARIEGGWTSIRTYANRLERTECC